MKTTRIVNSFHGTEAMSQDLRRPSKSEPTRVLKAS